MKKIVGMLAALGVAAAMPLTAWASAWQQTNGRWWYQMDGGKYPVNGWMWIDGDRNGIAECYYFDQDGWLLTDTTTPDGYQVNADGQWITYGQIRRVYSTAATREAVRTANDKTYRPREAARNHGKDGSFDEDTGKRVGGPESPFTQQTF